MANKNEIAIKLIVNDDGSVTVQKFAKNTEDSLGKVDGAAKKSTTSFDSLKGSYLEFTAKAASAYLAITKAMEYMDKGAKAAQAEESFRTLAAASDESADRIIANMKRATNSTIDDSAMMQKAAKAMLLEYSGDQIAKMSEMARLAARTSGEDVGATFDKIVDAISTNMPRTLKQMGLVTKEQMKMINQAMAEGVEGIDLYSIALANMNVQQAKRGPLLDDEAERMQQYRKNIEETKETIGKLLTVVVGEGLDILPALGSLFTKGDLTGITAYIEKLTQSKEETEKLSAARKEAAESERRRVEESIRAAQSELAQKKALLETMKAANKDYFTGQEANSKLAIAIQQAAAIDEFKIQTEALKRRQELNAEYYNRTKQEIALEAATRQKADRDKISDAAYVAQKLQILDAETAGKAAELARQRTLLSIQTAQNDVKALTSRLGEYQTYYDSLKAMMDKNTEDEKKHLEELKALRQQRVDIDKSTAALIAGIKGTDATLTAQQKYENARSGLNAQYGSAMNQTGQEQIKALEDYKQAVAALQAQYANGIPGMKDIFGKTDEIISAKTIAEDAISDIERATENQKNALAQLSAEKQTQIETDRLWGQTLQAEALKAQGQMESLRNVIADITAQIEAMQKTIEITGVDNVSSVVDAITARIEQLHKFAATPITITTITKNISSPSYTPSSWDLNLDAGLNLNAGLNLFGSYASGTSFVPRTGPYELHRGEAVIPADQNRGGAGVVISGDIIIQVPASAAPQSAEDWRMITRNIIVPELNRLKH